MIRKNLGKWIVRGKHGQKFTEKVFVLHSWGVTISCSLANWHFLEQRHSTGLQSLVNSLSSVWTRVLCCVGVQNF